MLCKLARRGLGRFRAAPRLGAAGPSTVTASCTRQEMGP